METDKRRLYIATTAINRPDLHNIVLESCGKFFRNTQLDIYWVINIDVIAHINHTYEETKQNYETMISKLIPSCNLIILPQNPNPSFTKAVIRVVTFLRNTMKPGDMLFWLEDDWRCCFDNYNIDHYCKRLSRDNFDIISLIPKCKLSLFYPMLRSYTAAKFMLDTLAFMPHDTRDPEEYSTKHTKYCPYDDVIIVVDKLSEPIEKHLANNIKQYNLNTKLVLSMKHVPEVCAVSRAISSNRLIFRDIGRTYARVNGLVKQFDSAEQYSLNSIVADAMKIVDEHIQ